MSIYNAYDLADAVHPEYNKDSEAFCFNLNKDKVVQKLQSFVDDIKAGRIYPSAISFTTKIEHEEFAESSMNLTYIEKRPPTEEEVKQAKELKKRFNDAQKKLGDEQIARLHNEANMPIEHPPQDFLDSIKYVGGTMLPVKISES